MNLNRTIRLGKKEVGLLDLLMFLALIVVGIVVRVCLFPYKSGDWEVFLEPWTNQLKTFGFKALAGSFYNYTPIYMYILWILTLLPIPTLLGIKLVSVLFDLLLAGVTARVTGQIKKGCNPLIPFAFVWFAPTVISNSSMWGQCDSIYTFFVLLTLYFLLKEKSAKAMLVYGIAFSIKLQSVFFAPVLILLFFLKKIKFREFFLIPAVYLVSIVPVWLAGRPLKELLAIYLGQAGGKNDTLSVIYPNLYYLIGNDVYQELYGRTAIVFTVAVLLVLFYYVLKKAYERGELSAQLLLLTALLGGCVIVFLLPSMRERYSYMVDILAVVYGCLNWKRLYIPAIKIFLSYMAYTTYYRYGMFISYEWLAVLQIVVIVVLTADLLRELHREPLNIP